MKRKWVGVAGSGDRVKRRERGDCMRRGCPSHAGGFPSDVIGQQAGRKDILTEREGNPDTNTSKTHVLTQ